MNAPSDNANPEPSYWSTEQRRRLAKHIKEQLAKITDAPYLLVTIQPETVFMRDQWLKELMGSIRGGWSIWIRETYIATTFHYDDYITTAIHEAAHAEIDCADPYHTDKDRRFKQNLKKLITKAKELSILPAKMLPPELHDLLGLSVHESTRKTVILLEQILHAIDKGRCAIPEKQTRPYRFMYETLAKATTSPTRTPP